MRKAEIQRDTKETQVRVVVDLDGCGAAKLASGIPFLDHMLDQLARHGALDLDVAAKGDLAVGECGPARDGPHHPAHRAQERTHLRPSHAPAQTAAKPSTLDAATYARAEVARPSWKRRIVSYS